MVSNTNLKEVVIYAKKPDEQLTRMNMGVERLNIQEVRKIPALMGEVDVIKALQLLPGVQAASEGSSGFSVRGGSPDQNLILLDNTTVYNPSHLMGFFSVFNNDVISGLELYKGDLPLKHGGRLSSLLDVQTKTEIPSKFLGTGGIGLISSRLMLEGPIGRKTSWMVGGRRSYADLFLKLSGDEAIRKSSIYFYDLNAKISHLFSDRDKLAFNAYHGIDNFGAEPGDFKYGNTAASLTWSHVFNEKLWGKFSANFTNYDYSLASKLDGARAQWESAITDIMLRADFNQSVNDAWNLTYGFSTTHHHFNPGIVNMENYPEYKVDGTNALEHAIYIGNEQKITDQLSLKYGLRFSAFQNIGKTTVFNYDTEHNPTDSTLYKSGEIYNTYTALEPRLGLVYRLNDQSSMKANYVRNIQYLQLANNSASGSPLDIWFSSGPNVKPQIVDQFSAGYFRNFNDNIFETSVELYYKKLDNVIDFAEHANLILNQKLEGEVRTGKGKSYGAEFMVKKNKGRLTGFVNYTLSRSERTIPEINNGKTYLAPYDKTHTINVVGTYELSKKVSLSATWIFATGNPTTYPTGRFEINGEYFPIYSGRNEYRKPDYDRLDLSLTYVPNPDSKKWWKGEWNFSIYNVYSRKNPWMITYNQDDATGLPYAEMIYLFGIVPSITYNFKF
ncbi:collagen-binding protein [Bacteroidia bacterium]|nr:collagen-binding protein [Bacteroidia bacterium]